MGYYVRLRVEGKDQQGAAFGPGVTQSVKDQQELAWQYFDISSLEFVHGNLESGLKYMCNVQAHNFMGGGPWSVGASTYLEIGTGSTKSVT